jgi:DnaJ-class molecular chaperone
MTCPYCKGKGYFEVPYNNSGAYGIFVSAVVPCDECEGKGTLPGADRAPPAEPPAEPGEPQ